MVKSYSWPVYLYTDGTNDHLSFQNNLKRCHQVNSLRAEGGMWHPPNSGPLLKKTVPVSMCFPWLFSKEGSVLKKINAWISWCSYPPGIRGGEFTYCHMIIGFQQTLLLPEICIMWSERREDSFCNMFFLLAVCRDCYRERKWKTSICDHMANVWSSQAPKEYAVFNFQTKWFWFILFSWPSGP